MTGSQLRARVLLEEARALGIGLVDLIAAEAFEAAQVPTVGSFIETVAPTFTDSTSATYRPYWRLAVARLGERRMVDVTTTETVSSRLHQNRRRNIPTWSP